MGVIPNLKYDWVANLRKTPHVDNTVLVEMLEISNLAKP
jgi:hypothetical protein